MERGREGITKGGRDGWREGARKRGRNCIWEGEVGSDGRKEGGEGGREGRR